MIERRLNERYKQEIINHLDLTAGTMAKAYTLKQLSFMDGVDTRKIKYSWRYIPVRFEDRHSRYDQRVGKNAKWYTMRRIRVDELIYIYNKRNKKKKLVEEYK